MKILHLLYESRGDYFGCGGVGSRAYAIYGHLRKRHDITLLCRKYPGAHDGEISGLYHIFVGRETRNFTLALLSYARKAARFVHTKGQDYDIIIEDFSPALPTFLNFYRKRPIVLQVQAYTGRQYFQKYNCLYSTALYLLEKIRPALYKYIIFVSESTKKKLRLNGRNSTGHQIIPNGIDEELLSLETGESDYILYLGRIDIHNKGLDTLITAYKDVHSACPSVRLVIAGDGRDMKRFRGLIETLPDHIKNSIEMAGWVDGDIKRTLLRDALMLLLPSRYEAQSIVALEAAAAAKPVIVSNIREFKIFEEKGAGLSFHADDPAMLADRIIRLLNDKDLRVNSGIRGRRMAEQLGWKKTAHHFEKFLKQINAAESRGDT